VRGYVLQATPAYWLRQIGHACPKTLLRDAPRNPLLTFPCVFMAIYRLSVTALSRSDGRNVLAAAAYRAGVKLRDTCEFFTKAAKAFDYRRRSGVVASGIILPEASPRAFTDRQALWNAAERMERRKDSRVAREIQLALPHELTDEQRQAAVTTFIKQHVVGAYGVAADYAIHRPDKRGDNRNHHAHILITTRAINGAGFEPAIMPELNDKARSGDEIKKLRKNWEILCNEALIEAQSSARVDCRSLKEQGIHRVPEPKQGAIATQMEREGRISHAGEERRAVKLFNDAVSCLDDKTQKQETRRARVKIKTARKRNTGFVAWIFRRAFRILKQRKRAQQDNICAAQRLFNKHWAKAPMQSNQNQPQAPPVNWLEL
jgi:hypothetical protein